MGELVQNGIGAALVLVVRGLRGKDVFIAEGHATGVFHRAGVELWDENLVVLAKGVGEAEVAVVEVETLLGLSKKALGIEGMCQRGAAVNTERDLELLRRLAFGVLGQLAAPSIGDLVVGACAQGNQVGR